MIKFLDKDYQKPFSDFKDLYEKALKKNQAFIEAAAVSSIDSVNKYPDSRFVNIKFVKGNELIFFTNYDSPKARQFKINPNVSILFFWPSISAQIRMRGRISKTDKEFSDTYFKNRDVAKNSLSISSNQSQIIDSYESVIKKYEVTLQNANLYIRPNYWGGFSFKPNYVELWQGKKID